MANGNRHLCGDYPDAAGRLSRSRSPLFTASRQDEGGSPTERAIASGLPAVLDCRTRFVPHPAMPLFGSMNRYGFGAPL